MKKLNNIEQIRNSLLFPNSGKKSDIFYMIQIIQRRKDNPEMKKPESHKGTFFVDSEIKFEKVIDEIKSLCDEKFARAYISLHPRSKVKLTESCLLEYSKAVVDKLINKDPWSIFNSAAGSDRTCITRSVYKRNRYLLDIDCDNKSLILEIVDYISKLTTIQLNIPTYNGIHLIVDAFNYSQDVKKYLEYISLNKDCNTILYASKK